MGEIDRTHRQRAWIVGGGVTFVIAAVVTILAINGLRDDEPSSDDMRSDAAFATDRAPRRAKAPESLPAADPFADVRARARDYLASMARLVGRVTFADGTSCRARIAVFSAAEGHPAAMDYPAMTNREGRFDEYPIQPGPAIVIIAPCEKTDRAFVPIHRNVEIRAATATDIGEIVVDETPSFTGEVVVARAPAVGIIVHCRRVLDDTEREWSTCSVGEIEFRWSLDGPVVSEISAVTKEDGKFAIVGLDVATFHITAEPPDPSISNDFIEQIAKDVAPPAHLAFNFDGCPLTLNVIDEVTEERITGFTFAIRDQKSPRKIAAQVVGNESASADQMLAPEATYELILSDADHLDYSTTISTSAAGTPIEFTARMKPRARSAALKVKVMGLTTHGEGFVCLSIKKIDEGRTTPWVPPYSLEIASANDPLKEWIRRDDSVVFDRLGLTPGHYRITARYNAAFTQAARPSSGPLDASFEVDMPANGVVESTVTFQPSARVTIDVMWTPGNARVVEWVMTDATGARFEPGFANGLSEFEGEVHPVPRRVSYTNANALPPGTYRVALQIDGEEKIFDMIEVTAGVKVTRDWTHVK